MIGFECQLSENIGAAVAIQGNCSYILYPFKEIVATFKEIVATFCLIGALLLLGKM